MAHLKTGGRFLLLLLLLSSIAFTSNLSRRFQLPTVLAQSSQTTYHIGNQTYISNLLQSTNISNNHIPIGANWTYTTMLNVGLKYHVYFIGKWTEETETNRTDYDIFVIDPSGACESTHTEAAGLPEHLGTTVDDPLYMPKQSGNYSYMILNDPKDSNGARNGTFMIIEHLNTNRLYQDKLYLQGREYNSSTIPNAWAYEFNSSSRNIEISVAVPDTLDMYEVRLYLMSNPGIGKGSMLSGMPIPWEQALYGRTYYDASKKYTLGGYNLDTTGYRGNALASCEYAGKDMLINYTSPYTGNLLYHLVFIAEYGYGNLSFMIKTDFSKPVFKVQGPSASVYAGQDVAIKATINSSYTPIDYLTLEYCINNSQTWTSTPMTLTAGAYTATIPSQQIGTSVTYRVTAYDKARNKAVQQASYNTVGQSSISLSTSAATVNTGENITVSGQLTPSIQHATISINYTLAQLKVVRTVETNSTGGFTDTFRPDSAGAWTINVGWRGDSRYASSLKSVDFTARTVSKPAPSFLETYLIYIIIAAAAVAGFIFFRWFRGRKKKEPEKKAYTPQLRRITR